MVVERGENQIQHEGMNTMNGSALLCAVFENGGKGAKFSSSSSGYAGLCGRFSEQQAAVLSHCTGGGWRREVSV